MQATWVLVYQCGIANVFRCEFLPTDGGHWLAAGRQAVRIMQGTFGQAEWFLRGIKATGAGCFTSHCDQAGDIANADWGFGPGELFTGSKATSL